MFALKRVASDCWKATNRLIATACAAVLVLGAQAAFATDPVTLPDTGVDLEGLVGAVILALGGVVTIIVGAYFGFLLVRKGMSWGRKIG